MALVALYRLQLDLRTITMTLYIQTTVYRKSGYLLCRDLGLPICIHSLSGGLGNTVDRQRSREREGGMREGEKGSKRDKRVLVNNAQRYTCMSVQRKCRSSSVHIVLLYIHVPIHTRYVCTVCVQHYIKRLVFIAVLAYQ